MTDEPPAGPASEEPPVAETHMATRAMELGFDVAERGARRLTAFVEQQGDLYDRTVDLATDTVTASTKAMAVDAEGRTTRDRQLGSFETAIVDFVKAVGPDVARSAARIMTGDPKLRGGSWRDNTVIAVRELGRQVTSLVNESVGGADVSGTTLTSPILRDHVLLRAVEDDTSVTLRLVDDEWIPRATGSAPPTAVKVSASPLVGGHHVLLPSEPVAWSGTNDPVQLTFTEAFEVGTYTGFVYATSTGSRKVGSTAVPADVLAAATSVTVEVSKRERR